MRLILALREGESTILSRERLNVAVIGCGDIVARHLEAWRREEERAAVVACCDPDAGRAEKAIEACGNPEARPVADYRELVGDPQVYAVDLCLPHHLHAPVAIAFAEAGKHVLCEKPLALNVAECDAMIRAAESNGVTLMHLEPQRMSATVAQAAEMVREGRIGRIVGIQGTFAYWQRAELNRDWRADPAQSGGGHLMDGGIHIIDAIRHLAGDVTAVQAMTAQYRPSSASRPMMRWSAAASVMSRRRSARGSSRSTATRRSIARRAFRGVRGCAFTARSSDCCTRRRHRRPATTRRQPTASARRGRGYAGALSAPIPICGRSPTRRSWCFARL